MTAPAPASVLRPENEDELVDAVRSVRRVIATGGLTKPRLSAVNATVLSTLSISGIVAYEPDEFTFTARAGTRVRELVDTLATKGQHLPFDPMFVLAGATIGGTVAAGLSGAGRLRFGGVRDFILGVRFVDGGGRLLRMGGKVVKNAAGFDVPKLLVGSLGRLGVLAEVTFKVFPAAQATRSLEFPVPDDESAVRMLQEIPLGRWEPRALEFDPDNRHVYLQLGGPNRALKPICRELLARWSGRVLDDADARALWTELRECTWAHADGSLLKAVFETRRLPELNSLRHVAPGSRWRITSAGDVAMISLPRDADGTAVGAMLHDRGLSALTLRGKGPLRPGVKTNHEIENAVKLAMDQSSRFPGIDE